MGMLWLGVAAVTLVVLVRSIGWLRTRRVRVGVLIEYREEAFDELVQHEFGEPPLGVGPGSARNTMSEPLRQMPTRTRLETEPATTQSVQPWAAAADLMIPTALLWDRWSAVDEHIFSAFNHLTHDDIRSASDLSLVIDVEGYRIKTAAFQRMLKGHVAEAYASEHASDAGHHVEMPEASNYPGTDAWLDGHAVNVKAVTDAGSLSHHFHRYPDVPVIVPIDSENIPEDALHFDPRHQVDFDQLGDVHAVIVDDALSNADVAAQVDDAMSVIDQPAVELGVPWVTVAISSFREGRLLLTGGTDVVRAAQNVAVDGLGVGGGAFVGAKAGAVAGAFFGPVGAALGSVVGGVVGGIKGRKFAAEIRRQPLVDAVAAVKNAQDAFQATAAQVSEDIAARWSDAKHREEESLRSSLAHERREHDAQILRLRDELFAMMVPSPADTQAMLEAAKADVSAIVAQTAAQLKSTSHGPRRWLARIFMPMDWVVLNTRKREAARWRARVRSLQSHASGPSGARELFNVLLAVPGQHAFVLARIRALQSLRVRAMTTLANLSASAFRRVTQMRSAASARLAKRWEGLQRDANAALEPRVAALKTAIAKCEDERRRAGLK